MNYPRVWVLPALLGLGQDETALLATLFAVVFALGMWAAAGRLHPSGMVIWAAALLSPSVLTLFERGNMDLLVLGLVAAATAAGGARGVALISVGAVLKLYPVAALVSVRTNMLQTALVAWALLVGYAIVTARDLALIATATPHPDVWSYGPGAGRGSPWYTTVS